jgi:hypothetical protein
VAASNDHQLAAFVALPFTNVCGDLALDVPKHSASAFVDDLEAGALQRCRDLIHGPFLRWVCADEPRTIEE